MVRLGLVIGPGLAENHGLYIGFSLNVEVWFGFIYWFGHNLIWLLGMMAKLQEAWV